MNSRLTSSTGWAANFSGIAAILGFVSLILFFGLESTPNSAQSPHFWGASHRHLHDPSDGFLVNRRIYASFEGAIKFVRDLLLPAGVFGGLAGWLIGRTMRAALITALAGFVFALGPGHNIPFLGNQPAT